MTLFNPSIFVNRLNVFKNGQTVVDLTFSKGFNVIYGENSSGKSSILEFLFYALGGDSPRWQPAARSCEEVICEIQANNDIITLRRTIPEEQNDLTSMDIYWGPLNEALEKANAFWERYPYKRSSSKESFTQVLFGHLGMPAVPTIEGANITMHQILRLVYSDQMTPPDEVFRQDRFDKQLTKEMVGEIICGVYDPQLYEIELERNSLSKRLLEVRGQLKSLFSAIGHVKDDLSLLSIHNKIEEVKQEQITLSKEITDLSQGLGDRKKTSLELEKEVDTLKKRLLLANANMKKMEERFNFLNLNKDDLFAFIQSLEQNLESLQNAEITASTFGEIRFENCPSCLSSLEQVSHGESCNLCGNPKSQREIAVRRLRLKRDLEMQIGESKYLYGENVTELNGLKTKLRALKRTIHSDKRHYAELSNPVISPEQIKIQTLYERLGYILRQEEELNGHLELGGRIDNLSKEKERLTGLLSGMDDKQAAIKAQRESRKSKASTLISETCRDFLHDDFERQTKFKKATHVGFDFSKSSDAVSVDGETRFSASSMVFLKNSFLMSILLASLEDDAFCFPRLMFFDGIEDKGMEVDRVHHLQKLIFKKSQEANTEHQIIITAEKLDDQFIDSEYIVGGRRFSHDDKSINVVGFG